MTTSTAPTAPAADPASSAPPPAPGRPLTRDLYLGLIEWDSSQDPTIYLGPDLAAVERLAAATLSQLEPDQVEDDEDFLRTHPAPDLDDPAAVHVWLADFHDATTIPYFSAYRAAPGDQQALGVLDSAT